MQSPKPRTVTRRHSTQLALVATSLLAHLASAQTPAATQPADADQPDNEVVQLSEFSVSTDRDYGYRASNSIAATRSNTPIKDVPVNIAVFTKDLYDDLLIINQVDLERYNASMVNGGADPRSDNAIQQAYNQFLFRGFVQNWGLRDGIRQYDPVDTQGLARVEVVKGPAAAMYGLSYAGGVMNNITKEVDFSRNFTSFRLTGQSEGQYRAAIDANYTGKVSGGAFGLRFNAAHTKSEDERAHSEGKIKHAQLSVEWRPTPTTQLRFLAEEGYRERPNGLGYFQRGEFYKTGQDNGSSVPLQIWHPEIPWEWNWANSGNMRSLDTNLYRGTINQQIGDNFSITGYIQYSTRQQIDGNGWDANGSGGADSWEAGGGWIGDPGAADERIEMGYSYRDWSNDMHSYGTTAVYKLDFDVVKNTFTFGANVWQEKFVSRASNQSLNGATNPNPIHISFPVRAGIPINIPYAPPTDFRPQTSGNGYTHENSSNDYYFAAWQSAWLENRLKLNAAINRTNIKLLQWANGEDADGPNVTRVSKNSPMFGVVFDITKEWSLFAVHGTSLFPSTDKNSFGAQMPPEVGKSYEGGVKFEAFDGRLSGTVSYYQITREGGGKRVSGIPNRDVQIWDSLTPAERALRYPNRTREQLLAEGDFTAAGELESTGYEADLVFQATRNWQIMLSYAHNDNETVASPLAADLGRKTLGSIENQFALVNKYTFSSGPVKGLSLGAGLQLAGKALQDYNGPNGAPRYNPSTTWLEVFGSYRFKMFGYNSVVQLNVKNLTKQEEFVGWRATGSPTVIATQRYEVPTEIRYALTLGIDL
jgi:iron complex outermembrane recepter protein